MLELNTTMSHTFDHGKNYLISLEDSHTHNITCPLPGTSPLALQLTIVSLDKPSTTKNKY